MALKLNPSSEEHEAFYQDFLRLLDKHTGKLPAIDMLAVASNTVGKLIAMQDQRQYTAQQLMVLISKNIEEGNLQAIAGILNDPPAGRG